MVDFYKMGDPLDAETAALSLLIHKGYTDTGGLLRHPDADHEETEDEANAIDYLCAEWDYAWMKEDK